MKVAVMRFKHSVQFLRIFLLLLIAVVCSIPHSVMALEAKQKELLNKNILYYNLENCNVGGSSTTGTTDLSGNDNVTKVYNYLTGKGLSKAQAAGIMANLNSESGINPKRVQGNGVIEADEITVNDKTGYGLAQWTSRGRQQGLADAAKAAGKPSSDLGVQLDYLWKELTTNFKGTYDKLKTTDDYAAAVNLIMNEFEAPQVRNGDERVNAFKATYEKLPEATGGSASDSGSTTSGGSSSSSCACSTSGETAAGKKGKTVAIDPGHGPSKTAVDSTTNLKMVESNNQPEGANVWDAAQKLKKKLESDGYNVVLTKHSENESVTFRERANRADDANADIAVSIHGDSGLPDDGQIYAQKVGLYRGDGANKTTFSDAVVAANSQKYADIFKDERQKAEGSSDIVVKDNSFDSRPGLEPGNLQMVQLFSKTPWVYNEDKMPFNTDKYVEGLKNGIEKSLDATADPEDESEDTGNACASGSAGNGDVIGTALNYAWPDYHPADYLVMKDTYKDAVQKAISAGKYVGGGEHPGIDCGGFVTRVMQDSGADPSYNDQKGGTDAQQKYMDSHKDKYENLGTPSNTGALKPGDIAINSTHTYMFVGPESAHPGFHGNSASASYKLWRTPMASNATDFKNYTWYRLKN